MRQYFTASEGCLLVAADYAQLEVRTAAALSQDPVLIEITQRDPKTFEGDLHAQTMRLVFGIPYNEQHRHKGIRTAAKVYFFTKLYGGSEDIVLMNLTKTALEQPELNIVIPSKSEVRKRLDGIADNYQRYFKEHVPAVIEKAREDGNVAYTMYGRPRFLPGLSSPLKEEREATEREAVSHSGQGTAADLARLATNLVANIRGGRLLLQVHDELVSDVGWRTVHGYRHQMAQSMALGQPLPNVPLHIDVGVGRTWRDCHK